MSNIQKGKYGEEIAAKYLTNNGYKIVQTNYKFSRYGEIDIIALDRDSTLCFIEVKTRTNNKFGAPLEAITKNKLLKIFSCIKNYTKNVNFRYEKCRIDAIAIELKDEPKITHIKNIEL